MSLQAGQKAPEFTLPATDHQKVSLNELLGQIVVLYFYPKDDTPGCTAQACGFRDNFGVLKSLGVSVLGVSKDNVRSHDKFKQKYSLNFPLLSDEDGKVLRAYGVWVEKSMMGKKYMGIERSTFLIDPRGEIVHIWRKVKVAGHVEQVIDAAHQLKLQEKAV